MHGPRVLAVVILAVAAAACMLPWVQSLHPLALESDSVFEQALVGTWVQKGGDTWTFQRSGDRGYDLVVTEKGSPAKFDAQLVRLGEFLFLDTAPGDPGITNLFYLLHFAPTHTISRAWLRGDVLLLAPLADEWLKEMLDQRRVTIANARVHDHIILTATTDELQKFAVDYADDPDAFPITIGLRRQK